MTKVLAINTIPIYHHANNASKIVMKNPLTKSTDCYYVSEIGDLTFYTWC